MDEPKTGRGGAVVGCVDATPATPEALARASADAGYPATVRD